MKQLAFLIVALCLQRFVTVSCDDDVSAIKETEDPQFSGNHFVAVRPPPGVVIATLSVATSSDSPVNVEITETETGTTAKLTVTKGSPKGRGVRAIDPWNYKGVVNIRATGGVITAHVIYINSSSTTVTNILQLIPVSYLGTEHRYKIVSPQCGGKQILYITPAPTEQRVRVRLTISVPIYVQQKFSPPIPVPLTFTVQKDRILMISSVSSQSNLNGFSFTSNGPIAVFLSHQFAGKVSFALQQVPPKSLHGSNYQIFIPDGISALTHVDPTNKDSCSKPITSAFTALKKDAVTVSYHGLDDKVDINRWFIAYPMKAHSSVYHIYHPVGVHDYYTSVSVTSHTRRTLLLNGKPVSLNWSRGVADDTEVFYGSFIVHPHEISPSLDDPNPIFVLEGNGKFSMTYYLTTSLPVSRPPTPTPAVQERTTAPAVQEKTTAPAVAGAGARSPTVVVQEKTKSPPTPVVCDDGQLADFHVRCLEWFYVLREMRKKPRVSMKEMMAKMPEENDVTAHKANCKWFFLRQDKSKDGKLSLREVSYVRNGLAKVEPCSNRFFNECFNGAEAVGEAAWFGCLGLPSDE
eukprot:m.2516 g.2516  ORF g.2516 m.2516 type:complete len:577 (+) comp8735_c0_seq1:123-1853(+)